MLTPSSSPPLLRLAIYRASSLGDVVLATACLDLLQHLQVPTEITWVGRGPALDVIALSWPNVRTLTVNRTDSVIELQRTIDQLRQNHLFIDLQCNLRSGWLARNLKAMHGVPYFSAEKAQLARSRLLVEARVRGRRRPLPEKSLIPQRLQYDLMCDALKLGLKHHLPADMLDGLNTIAVRPRLPIPADYDRPWRKELRFGSWLGVAPGAAHPTKQAPLTAMQGILDHVLATNERVGGLGPGPLGLVFYGDDTDRQTARQLLDQLRWEGPVLNLAGRLSLWETAVALSETACLLANDSSLGHIAEAVDTPTAILFGPTVEAFGFAPRMKQSRAFSTLLGCRPCSKHGKVGCRYEDKLCFSALNLEDISSHLLGLLRNPGSGRVVTLPSSPSLSSWAVPPSISLMPR